MNVAQQQNIHSHLTIDKLSNQELSRTRNISSALQLAELDQQLQTCYAIGVMRHGKTQKSDNEAPEGLSPHHVLFSDPPKSSSVPLSPVELNEEESTIFATTKSIATLGYKTIRLYCPEDTLRNTQTKDLIIKYSEKLGMEIILDSNFEHIRGFGARKKIDRSIITELKASGYMSDPEYSALNLDLNGEKHVLGKDKILAEYLSPNSLALLQNNNPKLYQNTVSQVEESYEKTIGGASESLDHLAQYISHNHLDDEYHLVIGYRTTIQALDKKFTEISPGEIDLNYSCAFGELHGATLNQQGSVLKQHKELWMPNITTYESDIAQLSLLDPLISIDNTLIENQNIVNRYLVGLGKCLEDHLKAGRTNLLTMYMKLGGLVCDLVIKTCLTLIQKNSHLVTSYEKFMSQYLKEGHINAGELDSLFDLTYSYKNTTNTWMMIFDKYSLNQQLLLTQKYPDSLIKELYQIYLQKESYLHGENKSQLQIKDTVTGEYVDLADLYVDQNFKIGNSAYTTTTLAAEIVQKPGTYILRAGGGEGKSTSLKAITKNILTQQSLPPVITFVTPDTDLNTIQSSYPRLLILDGLDEYNNQGETFMDNIKNQLGPTDTVIIGTRTYTSYNTNENIIEIDSMTQTQIDHYILHYLNQTFDIKGHEDPTLAETCIAEAKNIISQLPSHQINPLIISMIIAIMADPDLSIDLDTISTKSDLYNLIIAQIRKKSEREMNASQRGSYKINPYKGKAYDNTRLELLGKGYLHDNTGFSSGDEVMMADFDDDQEYITSTQILEQKGVSSFVDHLYQLSGSDQKLLVDSIIASGLIYETTSGRMGYFHKSILDYAAYTYLSQSNTFDKDITHILKNSCSQIDDEIEDISDDFGMIYSGLYMDGKITHEQFYNNEYRNNYFNQIMHESIQGILAPNIQQLIDALYFESEIVGNTMMDEVILLLYSNKPKSLNYGNIKKYLIKSLINAIKLKKDINDKSIIPKLELLLDVNVQVQDIKNYFDTKPIEYRDTMTQQEREKIKIKGKGMAACATLMGFDNHNNRGFYSSGLKGKQEFLAHLYDQDDLILQKLSQDDALKLIRTKTLGQWMELKRDEFRASKFGDTGISTIITKSGYIEYILGKTSDHKSRNTLRQKIQDNKSERENFLKYCGLGAGGMTKYSIKK